ncbi:dynein light chain Tctex-type 5-B-like [Physella acuta]|uniref:dynein light chain Tctex-type 5-B-like n=1 Tax=Physella acuta TaxID=109671 RepID=UPI0027DCD6A3|nr:dynein light chain Tctex-type 5-B-like [Physella acuta]
MSTEPLTLKAIEHHDKVHPRLSLSKHKASKDGLSSQKNRSRLMSRSESNRSISNSQHELSGRSPERQLSRSSLTNTRPSAGLSVFRLIAAARAWKKLSQKRCPVPETPKIRYENTFRLQPDPDRTFKADKIKPVINDILKRYLRHFKYTQDGSKQMCLAISSEVKSRVKGFDFPRYKIVCNVIIMQNKGQGSEICSRCIWSPETDSFASETFKTGHIICVVSVHAVYFE